MLSLVAGLLAVTLVPLPAVSQSATAAAAKNSLWKVEGGRSPVYLLGSIHFLRDDAYPLAKPIEAAFERAKAVAFEVDFATQNDPKVQMKMLTLGMCPPGKKLRDMVTEKTFALLDQHLEGRKLSSAQFQPLRPWMVAVSLVAMELQRLGFDPEAGVDRHFQKRAVKDGKRVIGFETIEFQLGLFADLNDEENDAFLRETIEESAKFGKIFGDMIRQWKTGDTKGLEKLVFEAMKEYPRLQKRLITDRNESWLPAVEKLLRGEDEAMVIVGAAHLIGKEGLAELLRKKGYKVTQQ